MEPTKPTKSTQRTGENKLTNVDLLRQMVKLSNNSVLTNQVANLLSNKLEKDDLFCKSCGNKLNRNEIKKEGPTMLTPIQCIARHLARPGHDVSQRTRPGRYAFRETYSPRLTFALSPGPYAAIMCGQSAAARPIHVPPVLAALFLYLKLAANGAFFRQTYEQPWMLAYADRPLRVDTSATRRKLDWRPRREYRVLNRLPVLMANFQNHRRYWQARNVLRNEGNYQFEL